MEWLNEYHLGGIAIGICTFLIIGLFHPIVVKAEYYWGTRCWWIFLVLGIAGIIGTVLISDILISSLLGVFSFSSFWTDYQGDIRATRTRAERLVSDESKTETRIRIETILSGQTLCNPIKGLLFLLQEAL